ncbi:MAG: peptidoglycan-binding domain-containing protein [Bacillota bacterium]
MTGDQADGVFGPRTEQAVRAFLAGTGQVLRRDTWVPKRLSS